MIKNIITHFEKNNNIINKIKTPLEILKFESIEEIEKYLKYNTIVIINSKFINCFGQKAPKNQNIQININGNEITVNLNGNSKIFYLTKNFILKEEYIYLRKFEIMIKIYNFNEYIIQSIKQPYSNNENKIKNIFLINKDIISEYKQFFEYNKIFNIINNDKENIKKENNINNNIIKDEYNLIKEKLDEIDKKLDIKDKNNIKDKKIINFREINENKEFEFNLKYFDNTDYYIDNLEIINNDILLYFLNHKIIQEDNYLFGQCLYGDNKLFISFKYENKYNYILGTMNKENNLDIEYVIYLLDKSNKNFIKKLKIMVLTNF